MTDKEIAYKMGKQNAEKCNEAQRRGEKEPPLERTILDEYRRGFNDHYDTKNDD